MADYIFIYSNTPSPGAINVNKVVEGNLGLREHLIVSKLRANDAIVKVIDANGQLLEENSFNVVCDRLYKKFITEASHTSSRSRDKIIYLIPVEPPIDFKSRH